MIQITSYNFTGTGRMPERCAGIVKAVPIHHKYPADLATIQTKNELSCPFILQILPKPIDFIRVHCATEESLSHDEVQFWWTVRH